MLKDYGQALVQAVVKASIDLPNSLIDNSAEVVYELSLIDKGVRPAPPVDSLLHIVLPLFGSSFSQLKRRLHLRVFVFGDSGCRSGFMLDFSRCTPRAPVERSSPLPSNWRSSTRPLPGRLNSLAWPFSVCFAMLLH